MSLLEDARDMDCMCNADEGNHGDECVLIIKSRIVAALEAAEAVANDHLESPLACPLDSKLMIALMDALGGKE